ncbi:hypothetical protein OOK36_08270 [Streptomyces sp. NBC_00365]|uniref:hypothetical protein n=1 Tax=Streptomyces sp. NBC_00365 TaxID=2975726 RepID=UPI00224E2909|nr:hypothetical protein [Streptomyces sp. NBC_00365]MCX5088891.1 hypothetical protein [Streptomyces sp. NBC_00365]
MNCDAVSLVLALSAAARSFAPDVWFLVRRLLGAGVRIGAATLIDQQPPPSPSTTASLDEGGRR